jgi:hypothetical protein
MALYAQWTRKMLCCGSPHQAFRTGLQASFEELFSFSITYPRKPAARRKVGNQHHRVSAEIYLLFSVQLVDAVTNACSQICIHLSDSLFDLVLNMIFDYASTNVRPNAVRAVHQLVECVANAHPEKTLAKFVPFCIHNIEVELENGASSTRTTSTLSTPLPSDATFHWSMERFSLMLHFY